MPKEKILENESNLSLVQGESNLSLDISLSDPTEPNHIVNKKYVDSSINELKAKLDDITTEVNTLREETMPVVGDYKYIPYNAPIPYNWIRVPKAITLLLQTPTETILGNMFLACYNGGAQTAEVMLQTTIPMFPKRMVLQRTYLIQYQPNVYQKVIRSKFTENELLEMYSQEINTYSNEEQRTSMEHYLEWIEQKIGN